MLAQVAEGTKIFHETAATWGLAVGILIVMVLVLSAVLWIIARHVSRWIQPMVEEFFTNHLLTMKLVRETVASQADSVNRLASTSGSMLEGQKQAADKLETINKEQNQKLETLTQATMQTNKILLENGKCRAEEMRSLVQQLNIKSP